MKILLYGVNHHCAPIEIREKYAVEEADLASKLNDISSFSGVEEVVILTTCNRTEYYLYVDPEEFKHGDLLHYLSDHSGYDVTQVIATTYGKSNMSAASHLFNVASGLDSSIIGENQILSQVKNAHQVAHINHTTGPILNSLFNKAVSFSKKMHTVTKIDQVSRDASSAAVQLFKKEWLEFKDKRFLIIGAGKMAQSAAKALVYQGAESITIASRNYEKTKSIVEHLNEWSLKFRRKESNIRTFQTGDFDHLPMCMAKVDGIISATTSPELLVNKKAINQMNEIRFTKKKQWIMDLSVPRNIDSSLNKDEFIELHDMDTISNEVKSNNELQEKEILHIETELKEAVYQFNFWYKERQSIPYLVEYNTKNKHIKDSVTLSLKNKLPGLSDHEALVIEKHMESIINQMAKAPIQAMKDLSKVDSTEKAERELKRFASKIGLRKEEEIEQEQPKQTNIMMKKETKFHALDRKEVVSLENYR